MGSSLPIVFAALVLAACSTVGDGDAASCKGAPRPANPHGSVLAPVANEAAPPAAAAGSAASCGPVRP